ncbi:MAG: phosphoribosylformylglycinamidine synthase [Candidatus Saganbacteria bacterium]|uniref:Phosphoribosylformylglycinamidine synthase subunit PurL n=1 Tax=Candidatus Saganbacteria bacterium TaxID=2575572 RepID=A0A833L3Z6_UNCSA|nr:MAG: phosphoribosylformylglycinamidine synthase [Candidatus Saganbacteria bacterium]
MIKPEIYKALGLEDVDYQRIENILGREPTYTELAMYSVEWSEHCGYSSSKKYLKLFPQTGKYETLVGEDSGGIIVDDIAIIFKMESHNHPSQVEPKQGAATGVGGIIRDIFTAGARPIASLNSLRFGPLSDPYNRYLLVGVVDGIAFYGNCLGVPTVGGEIYFDESYSGNCLVNAMSIGICKRKEVVRARAQGIGNSIMYVGSSTGRDGIGGCSVLASAEFCDAEEEKRPTVQIGDPFTEKCLIEATLEILATGHVVGIKDMGAAGLTCSTSEMAAAGGVGIEIDIAGVPRREEGMQPYEVMMSESQERMLVCVKAGKEKEITEIFEKWDLNAVVIGKVNDSNVVTVKDNGKIVAEMTTSSLTNPPLFDLPYKRPDYLDEVNKLDFNNIQAPKDLNSALLKLISCPTIANKAWIYEQYDHMVQTNTCVLPGSDAAVLRVKGMKKGIAAVSDCNSRYCFLDPFIGAQIAVAEAARNLVCSGADPAAVTDCLNFGNPKKPDRFYYFKNCVEGIISACKSFQTAVVSGNVSFYNESPKGAINPTPTIGMIGILEDISHRITSYFKDEGDAVFLLGETFEEIGGSEYLKVIHGAVKGLPPKVDLEKEKRLHAMMLEAIKSGIIKSAHDCSEGGLGTTIAECCIINQDKMIGVEININSILRPDILLFSESQSRIIISCGQKDIQNIISLAKKHNIPVNEIGRVGGSRLAIKGLIDLSVDDLSKNWRTAFK